MSRCFEGSSSAAGFLVHFNEWRCSEFLQTNSKALLVFWEVFWVFLGVFQDVLVFLEILPACCKGCFAAILA